MSVIGNAITLGSSGGGGSTYEPFCVISGWQMGGQTSQTNGMRTQDYTGTHFSSYASFSSSQIQITSACTLDFAITIRVSNSNTRTTCNYTLILTRNGSDTNLAQVTDNNGPAAFTGPIQLQAGDVIYGNLATSGGAYHVTETIAYLVT